MNTTLEHAFRDFKEFRNRSGGLTREQEKAIFAKGWRGGTSKPKQSEAGFLKGFGEGAENVLKGITFGLTDKIGFTDTSDNTGKANKASQFLAALGRESLIAALTMGAGNYVSALRAARAAKIAQAAELAKIAGLGDDVLRVGASLADDAVRVGASLSDDAAKTLARSISYEAENQVVDKMARALTSNADDAQRLATTLWDKKDLYRMADGGVDFKALGKYVFENQPFSDAQVAKAVTAGLKSVADDAVRIGASLSDDAAKTLARSISYEAENQVVDKMARALTSNADDAQRLATTLWDKKDLYRMADGGVDFKALGKYVFENQPFSDAQVAKAVTAGLKSVADDAVRIGIDTSDDALRIALDGADDMAQWSRYNVEGLRSTSDLAEKAANLSKYYGNDYVRMAEDVMAGDDALRASLKALKKAGHPKARAALSWVDEFGKTGEQLSDQAKTYVRRLNLPDNLTEGQIMKAVKAEYEYAPQAVATSIDDVVARIAEKAGTKLTRYGTETIDDVLGLADDLAGIPAEAPNNMISRIIQTYGQGALGKPQTWAQRFAEQAAYNAKYGNPLLNRELSKSQLAAIHAKSGSGGGTIKPASGPIAGSGTPHLPGNRNEPAQPALQSGPQPNPPRGGNGGILGAPAEQPNTMPAPGGGRTVVSIDEMLLQNGMIKTPNGARAIGPEDGDKWVKYMTDSGNLNQVPEPMLREYLDRIGKNMGYSADDMLSNYEKLTGNKYVDESGQDQWTPPYNTDPNAAPPGGYMPTGPVVAQEKLPQGKEPPGTTYGYDPNTNTIGYTKTGAKDGSTLQKTNRDKAVGGIKRMQLAGGASALQDRLKATTSQLLKGV